jgi:C-terminal processing protease CtpA/Prc
VRSEAHCGFTPQSQLFWLTGLYTFSAAVEFAEAAKTYGLATIVGEVTEGQPNSFGNPRAFQLPHAGLTATIATAQSVRANGNTTDFNSVTPDIIVRTSAEDIRKGRDPVLERAKDCLQRGHDARTSFLSSRSCRPARPSTESRRKCRRSCRRRTRSGTEGGTGGMSSTAPT